MLTKILILLIKLLLLFKKVITFILKIAKKIIISILGFLFFKILVKLYYNYILIYKKIKEINKRNNSRLYLFKKNIPIFIIILLSIVIIFGNKIKKTEAQNLSNQIHKTTLAKNIKSDFEDLEPEELVVEIISDYQSSIISSPKYLEQSGALTPRTQTKIGPTEDDDIFIMPDHGDTLYGIGIIGAEKGDNKKRTEVIEYIVQAGDTISSIASNFNLSVNTILWENKLTARSIIKPGSSLTILPENGIIHTVAKNENIGSIAKKYSIEIEKILEGNEIESGDPIKIGQKLFIPGGQKIVERTAVVSRSYSGTTITQTTPAAGSQQPAYTGGKLLWPTVGNRITQYYSWSHRGLDIANKTGTPLYAAESGTVESSGWSNGYGYNVVINHGGGMKTLYAHASKLHVSAGEKVNRGDIIANMGSTGWSTGPHIHFEVIVNGVKQNPLNYIR